MKRIQGLAIGGVLVSSIFLGGCNLVAQPADTTTESPTQSFTGSITGAGDKYSITSNGRLIEITSRKVDFSNYVGTEVTVTGEFSGTTLYVDEIK